LTVSRIYIKHQAFDSAYEEVENGKELQEIGFELPKTYHHDPIRLDRFKHYTHYLNWLNKLYSSTNDLINELENIYNDAKRANLCILSSRAKISNILSELEKISIDLYDLRNDILEFENCVLATHISGNDGYIAVISGQRKYIDSLETRIIDTCNQKIYEISSKRLSLAGIIIGLCAVIVATVSLYLNYK
jgi:hypothetical protein